MIGLEAFKKLLDENEGKFPLLTLEEFFMGNTREDAIAPNQCGEGRPSLAEIWEALRKIEQRPDVAWVRVALHDDTEIEVYDGKETLYLSGDSIVLCTALEAEEIEKLADCGWLCSDGAAKTEASELDIFSCVPPVPEGFHCVEIVWD